MIVVRFRVKCRPGKSGPLVAAFKEIITASRPLDGVVSFDIGQDLADPDAFIATEVFTDKVALALQEELAEVQRAMGLMEDVLAEPPETTIYHIASSEPG